MTESSHNSASRNGAELLVRCLEGHKVPFVFGIPGAKVDSIFDVLADHGPELILCRHEQNAAFMAGAVGRLTGIPGVCLATSGPGASNLVTGLATATTEGDPVVAFGGAVSRAELLKQTHQSMDTVSLFKPVTKYSAEMDAPEVIPEIIANAFRAATAPRPGAAFVSMPKDVLCGPASEPPLIPSAGIRLGPAANDAITDAVKLLTKAKQPVILVGMGGGAPAATAAIRRFLHKHRLPVVNTFEGAGVLSRDLVDLFFGRIGLFHNQTGDQLLEKADVVVTVGYDPVEYDPVFWNEKRQCRIIHLDSSRADMDNYYNPAVELIGDIAATLGQLSHTLGDGHNYTVGPELEKMREAFWVEREAGKSHNGSPVHPLRLVRELRGLLSDDVTVICDVGSIYIWMARYFESFEPRRLLFSNGQQTLGVALPWAIATTLVRPGEKVVSMSGDGGFLFSAMELETAVRIKAPLVHLVWRDGSYDMVRIQQQMKYGRDFGVELGSPDIVEFARSFGAYGYRIETPEQIVPMMKEAMEKDGPVLIDVPIDYRDNAALCRTVVKSDIGG